MRRTTMMMAFVLVVMCTTGCISNEGNESETYRDPDTGVFVGDDVVFFVGGVNGEQVVRGGRIFVSGTNNTVHITNDNVKVIDLKDDSVGNRVYYPHGAHPKVLDHGTDNIIISE